MVYISIYHSIIYFIVYHSLVRLRTTSQRLGAAAADTTVYAGYKRSFSHCLFCGATAAVAPNRQLCAGIFTFHFAFFLNFTIFNKSANCSCLLILTIKGRSFPMGFILQKSSLICSEISNSAIPSKCLSKKKKPV